MKNSTAIILILISIGLFYTFISPEYQKVKAHRVEASNYQNVIENVNAISTTRDTLLLKYQQIPKVDIARLEKVLPDHVDTVRLAMDLDGIASKYGITIKNIEVTSAKEDNSTTIVEPDSGTPYGKVTESFTFVSTYDNFRKFMSDIEKSLRVTDVRDVSFTTSDNGFYEYKVTIDTYWLK